MSYPRLRLKRPESPNQVDDSVVLVVTSATCLNQVIVLSTVIGRATANEAELVVILHCNLLSVAGRSRIDNVFVHESIVCYLSAERNLLRQGVFF